MRLKAGSRPRPQEAEHDDALHPCPLRRLDHGLGSLDVHTLVGLVTDLAVDAGAVGDRVAPGDLLTVRRLP